MKLSRMQTVSVVLGMAFYWPLFRSFYFGMVFSGNGAEAGFGFTDRMGYLFLLLLLMVLAVIAAFRSRRLGSFLSSHRWMVPAIATITSLCTVLMLFSGGGNDGLSASGVGSMFHSVIVVFSVVAFAFYVLVITLAWGVLVASIEQRQSVSSLLALSFFLSFVVSLTTQLNGPLGSLVPVIGPLFCGFCWYPLPLSKGGSEPFRLPLLKQAEFRMVFVLILFLLIGSVIRGFFAAGVLDYNPSPGPMTRSYMSILLAAMLTLAVYFSAHHERLINALWVTFVLIFFTGLFIVAASSATWWGLGNDVVIMSRTFLGYFLWIVSASIAQKHRLNPIVLFAVFFILTDCASGIITNYLIPLFAGNSPLLSNEYTGAFALIMALILLVGSFVYLSTLAFRKVAQGGGGGNGPSRKSICDDIAIRRKLTARESDVLFMVSQGHSTKKIAETLFVSTSTTQSHLKSLYKKMGLHSKQAIIDSVNRALAQHDGMD